MMKKIKFGLFVLLLAGVESISSKLDTFGGGNTEMGIPECQV
ncbi:MAG: hypothetical protein U0T81_14150 [Saprospiraceae bacterium]